MTGATEAQIIIITILHRPQIMAGKQQGKLNTRETHQTYAIRQNNNESWSQQASRDFIKTTVI